MEKMNTTEPDFAEFFDQRKRRNPLVPIGALMTAGVLTAGLISFRNGNSQLGQKLMRARVVVQGATVALMVSTAYFYGGNPWKSKIPTPRLEVMPTLLPNLLVSGARKTPIYQHFQSITLQRRSWDFNGGACRSIMNKRNWILVWEDGFCNFAASTCRNSDLQHFSGMHPEVFFKMSHEIYNYGEGLIGKVAAENRHDWVYNEDTDQNSCDPNPRTWNAQFLSGLQTIALIAVNEGVLQLGSLQKIQRQFSFLHTIPGFLLPHPSMTTLSNSHDHRHENDDNCNNRHVMVSSSISSLEALPSQSSHL